MFGHGIIKPHTRKDGDPVYYSGGKRKAKAKSKTMPRPKVKAKAKAKAKAKSKMRGY